MTPPNNLNKPQKVIVISAGGTIEKTYDESDGRLKNKGPTIEHMIHRRLRLPYTDVQVFSILAKDSLDMTDEDRTLLKTVIGTKLFQKVPLIVLHGTDTMNISADYCFETLPSSLPVPIVFTGAMRPLGVEDSDALQNVTEAILASTLLESGIYICFHGRVHKVPGVKKNKTTKTFERITS